MDPMDLARWTRFAAKGGIGRCTALVDCIAQEMGEDLMFLKDDEITVLMQLPEAGFYLGHCEGVVGRFSGKDVQFHGKLKRPVMAKRGSIGVPAVGGSVDGRTSSSERSGSAGGSSDAEREGVGFIEKDRQKEKERLSADRATKVSSSTSAPSPSSPSGSSARGTPSPMTRSYFQSTSVPLPPSVDTHTTSPLAGENKTHSKAHGVATSISGSSVYSVNSEAASVYSTATSAYSTGSEGTETQHVGTAALSRPNPVQLSSSAGAGSMVPAASGSTSTLSASMSATTLTTSISEKSFTSESTYGSSGSLGFVGKGISELGSDPKIGSGFRDTLDTKFTLVPSLELSALDMSHNVQGSGSRSKITPVAPLRVTKSPRPTPSPNPTLGPSVVSTESSLTTEDVRLPSGVVPGPPSPGVSGSRSPDVPGSLSPGLSGSRPSGSSGTRSLGIPGSLSPGQRSPVFPTTPSSAVFTTPQSHTPSAPNLHASSVGTYPSSYSHPAPASPLPPMSPPPTSPLPAPPTASTYTGTSGSLSPPPGSPLPPLPPSLPSPTFPTSTLPSSPPQAQFRSQIPSLSPLPPPAASLPSPAFPLSDSRAQVVISQTVKEKDMGKGEPRLGYMNERDAESATEEFEEGNTTRLSTLDALQRRMEDEDESSFSIQHPQTDDIENGGDGSGGDAEEADSDGEVGIGLSLMGALGDDDDDEEEDGAGAKGVDARLYGKGEAGGKALSPPAGAIGGTMPISWTRYTPASPIAATSSQGTNGENTGLATISKVEEVEAAAPREGNGEVGSGVEEGEEEEDDGAYWDDIYDDYRYSRYSVTSKRFSVASKRISVISKASAASKSSKSSHSVPPVPVPNFSPDRPSFGSDRPSASVYSRPSFDSTSTSASTTMLHARPSFERSISEESHSSSYSTQTLSPLSTQFPAVPTGVPVPVSVEPRLRIVNEGVVGGEGDAHGEKEMEVVHDSTENHLENQDEKAVEAQHSLDNEGGNGDREKPINRLVTNTAISPLLHTSFGSPHSSRAMSAYTDTEDGSEQGHGYVPRNTGKSPGSGKSLVDSLRSPVEELKSLVEEGGMASTPRMKLESERAEPSSVPVGSASTKSGPGAGLGMGAIVVDDDEGHAPGVGGEDLFTSPSMGATSTAHTATSPSSIPDASQSTLPASLTAGRPLNEVSSARPREPNSQLHPFSRTSIFLPHPNAPKSGFRSPGPMYGRPTTQDQSDPVPGSGAMKNTFPSVPPNASAFSAQVVHHLRSISLAKGPARRPPMTLFGRCQPDLSTSTGPVPIVFSLDPLPPLQPINKSIAQGQGQQRREVQGQGQGIGPPAPPPPPARAATVSVPARRSSMAPGALANLWSANASSTNTPPENPKNTAKDVPPVSDRPPSLRLPRRSATALTAPQEKTQTTTDAPIPRADFVPQVGVARPRSRSFSAFGTNVNSATLPERSYEEPVAKMQDVPSSPVRSGNSIPSALMPRHVPSPLSLRNSNLRGEPGTNIVIVGSAPSSSREQLKSPTSPVTRSPTYAPANSSPALSSPPPVPSPKTVSDKEMESNVSLMPGSSIPTGSSGSSNVRSITSPHLWKSTHHGSLDVPPHQNSLDGAAPRKSSDSGDSSITSPPPIAETFSQSPRSSPLTHEVPLRNKLSLPVLRGKAPVRQRADDAASIVSFAGSAENETVQVQDMDFELVKPSIPQVTERASQDSAFASREDGGRHDSPGLAGDAGSIQSSAPRSPMVPADPSSGSTAAESPTLSVDAHRQRELKWMALLPSIPPSQARKNKKVRRLLSEGVPSSVRYLVWCHLTDSKTRALPDLYTQLNKRPRIPAFAAVEKDATRCFPDQLQLHTAQGPIASLLQAYLSMVPDVEYSSGLVSIAGQLLLLAPEEDAFWIFTSVMDSHLRQYFASNDMHIEIDATLFSNALESLDSNVHQKLYTVLSINPRSVTRPWFTTLFVGSLPTECLHRVWDIFLYEGITWLFRVGLVLCQCIRHLLLQASSEEAALEYLLHPPLACLPSSAESFLQRVSTVKMKDDDIRKQRVKMETQLKQRPPHRVLSAGSGGTQPLVISRPKT